MVEIRPNLLVIIMNVYGSKFPVTTKRLQVSFSSKVLILQWRECEVWNEPGQAILLNNFHLPNFPGNWEPAMDTDIKWKKIHYIERRKHLLQRKGSGEERRASERRGEGYSHLSQHWGTQEPLLICCFILNSFREKTVTIL